MAAVDKQVWDNVAKLEDDDCVKRFLCEVATESFEAPDYQPLVQSIIAGDNVRAFFKFGQRTVPKNWNQAQIP